MIYRNVERLSLNSEEFCFSYQGHIITDSYNKPLSLEKEPKTSLDSIDDLKSEGFIDCLISLGEI